MNGVYKSGVAGSWDEERATLSSRLSDIYRKKALRDCEVYEPTIPAASTLLRPNGLAPPEEFHTQWLGGYHQNALVQNWLSSAETNREKWAAVNSQRYFYQQMATPGRRPTDFYGPGTGTQLQTVVDQRVPMPTQVIEVDFDTNPDSFYDTGPKMVDYLRQPETEVFERIPETDVLADRRGVQFDFGNTGNIMLPNIISTYTSNPLATDDNEVYNDELYMAWLQSLQGRNEMFEANAKALDLSKTIQQYATSLASRLPGLVSLTPLSNMSLAMKQLEIQEALSELHTYLNKPDTMAHEKSITELVKKIRDAVTAVVVQLNESDKAKLLKDITGLAEVISQKPLPMPHAENDLITDVAAQVQIWLTMLQKVTGDTILQRAQSLANELSLLRTAGNPNPLLAAPPPQTAAIGQPGDENPPAGTSPQPPPPPPPPGAPDSQGAVGVTSGTLPITPTGTSTVAQTPVATSISSPTSVTVAPAHGTLPPMYETFDEFRRVVPREDMSTRELAAGIIRQIRRRLTLSGAISLAQDQELALMLDELEGTRKMSAESILADIAVIDSYLHTHIGVLNAPNVIDPTKQPIDLFVPSATAAPTAAAPVAAPVAPTTPTTTTRSALIPSAAVNPDADNAAQATAATSLGNTPPPPPPPQRAAPKTPIGQILSSSAQVATTPYIDTTTLARHGRKNSPGTASIVSVSSGSDAVQWLEPAAGPGNQPLIKMPDTSGISSLRVTPQVKFARLQSGIKAAKEAIASVKNDKVLEFINSQDSTTHAPVLLDVDANTLSAAEAERCVDALQVYVKEVLEPAISATNAIAVGELSPDVTIVRPEDLPVETVKSSVVRSRAPRYATPPEESTTTVAPQETTTASTAVTTQSATTSTTPAAQPTSEPIVVDDSSSTAPSVIEVSDSSSPEKTLTYGDGLPLVRLHDPRETAIKSAKIERLDLLVNTLWLYRPILKKAGIIPTTQRELKVILEDLAIEDPDSGVWMVPSHEAPRTYNNFYVSQLAPIAKMWNSNIARHNREERLATPSQQYTYDRVTRSLKAGSKNIVNKEPVHTEDRHAGVKRKYERLGVGDLSSLVKGKHYAEMERDESPAPSTAVNNPIHKRLLELSNLL